jgi:uncharacterized protein YdcH (DUF465 family)
MNRIQIQSELAQILDRLKNNDAPDEQILRELVNYVDDKITGREEEIERLNQIIQATKHLI